MALQIFAESALSGCFQTLFQSLGPIFNKGLGILLGVNTELQKLEQELSLIQDVLTDAERRSTTEKAVHRWMTDLREVTYDMEDIVDEMNTEQLRLAIEGNNHPSDEQVSNITFSRVYNKVNEVKFHTLIKGKIEHVLQKLSDVAQRAEALGLRREAGEEASFLSIHGRLKRETSPSVDESEAYGRTRDIEKVVELMFETGGNNRKNYDVITLVGMGGIGKTTLAKLVFHDERVRRRFDLQSWAFVSDVFDVTRVTKDLIEYATREYSPPQMALSTLQDRLGDMVKKKRFLLVLDDVWTAKEWDAMKSPLNDCVKGSKVLVTTRSRKVANNLSKTLSYDVGALDDQSCWELFEERAFGDPANANVDGKLKEIGHRILEKCNGVPLAIKVLGSNLRNAEEEKWESILNNEFWQLADEDDEIFPALKLSYHVLPSSLKRCFKHFSLFPADYIFDKEELVRMWIAENLIEAKEGRLLPVIGSEYYEDLQNRSLIQMDNKMHDLIHSMSCLVAGKFYCRVLKETDSNNISATSRHASLTGRDLRAAHFESVVGAKGLHTILLFNCNSNNLLCNLSNWRALRVLSLRDTRVIDVPNSVIDLKHLRYLDFSFNSGMSYLPDAICSLYNLQVLDLKECLSLTSLPNAIGNLRCLFYLDLSYTPILSLPTSVCHLAQLQTLHLAGCRMLTQLPERFCQLETLKVLDISGCKSLRQLPEDMGNLRSLQKLNCRSSSIPSLPDTISNIKCLREIENYADDGGLQEFVNNNESGKIIKLPPYIGRMTQLRHLGGYSVENEMGQGVEELKDMNNLEGKLVIANLNKVSSGAEAGMADLKGKKQIHELIMKWNGSSALEAGSSSSSSSISSAVQVQSEVLEALHPETTCLTHLSFQYYEGDRLPCWMYEGLFSSLRYLRIMGLRSITRIVEVNFPLLEELRVGKCLNLKQISIIAPKLRLLKVVNCKELLSLSMPASSLEHLTLMWLFRLANLSDSGCSTHCSPDFEGGQGPGEWMLPYLPALNTLNVDGCCSVRTLSTRQPLPPTLRQFRVEDCPNLESLFQMGTIELPSTIEKLAISRCPLLNMRNPLGQGLLQRLTSLEDLTTDCSPQSHQDLFQLPAGMSLPTLKTLTLIGSKNNIPLFTTTSWLKNFTCLLKLRISDIPDLQTLPDDCLPPNLRALSLSVCTNLPSLPMTLHSLARLRILFISHCPQLVSVSDVHLPPSLCALGIWHCQSLTLLPKDLDSLRSLRLLHLARCPQLEVRAEDRLPPGLSRLEVHDCLKLERQLQEKVRKDWLVLMRRPRW